MIILKYTKKPNKLHFRYLNNLSWNSDNFLEIIKTDFDSSGCILVTGQPITNLMIAFNKQMTASKYILNIKKWHFRFLNYSHWNSDNFLQITKTDLDLGRSILVTGERIPSFFAGFHKEVIVLKYIKKENKLHFRFLKNLRWNTDIFLKLLKTDLDLSRYTFVTD